MRKLLNTGFAAALLALGAFGPAWAADEEVGRIQFLYSCASCHGEDAKGGSVADGIFRRNAPDLTRMAAQTGGTFPYDAVIATIDGRGGMRGHRSPMPVWGTVLQNNYEAVSSGEIADLMAQGAILSITLYLASIQEY